MQIVCPHCQPSYRVDTPAFPPRLASPPPEPRGVPVRFFNRHDLGVGIQ